jgi:hypothetical protein
VYLGEIGGTRAAHDPLVEAELFDKANAAIRARRTRPPGRRKVEETLDPFLLRGQLRCVRCGRIMTTASAKAKTRFAEQLRYYRCRASRSCRGTQVRANEIEQRVLRWLQSPRRTQMESEAGLVFAAFESIWPVLLPATIRSLVHQLIWEVRWNARANRFVVMLDEVAVRGYAEELGGASVESTGTGPASNRCGSPKHRRR